MKTATKFWQEKFNELPQNDAEKLAVAMMAEYAAEHDQGIIQMIDEVKEMLHSRLDITVLEVQHILTELKQKILEGKK